MKGLELARAYYETHGRQMIETYFPAYAERIAVGLAGEGSECFGYDDILSQDHDFGPSFCMWLTREDYEAIGPALQEAYQALPRDFYGYAPRVEEPNAGRRVGALCMDDFFLQQIGRANGEFTLLEWMRVPESRLATVTNGEVFNDSLGKFTAIRQHLINDYPNDIRLKKMAARAAIMGQSGQYNYARTMRRGEVVAAGHARSEFIQHTISMVFLLNRRFVPYYKWMHRGLLDLPVLGAEVGELLRTLATNPLSMDIWQKDALSRAPQALNTADENILLIEAVCRLVADQLRAEGLSSEAGSFLVDHGMSIMTRIQDPQLRALHLMQG